MSQISVYNNQGTYNSSKTAIYDTSFNLKASSNQINVGNNTWNDYTISIELTAGDYYLCQWTDGTPYHNYVRYATDSYTTGYLSLSYTGTFPDPITFDSTDDNKKVTIYATYEPSGGGDPYYGHTGGDWCWKRED